MTIPFNGFFVSLPFRPTLTGLEALASLCLWLKTSETFTIRPYPSTTAHRPYTLPTRPMFTSRHTISRSMTSRDWTGQHTA
ncbi:hypothetical protein C8R44DRAFT_756355 [Mycena epipterygia]|nr:hypothetical protein C8R44DRAFT_756355 [Mycena epipterygia]